MKPKTPFNFIAGRKRQPLLAAGALLALLTVVPPVVRAADGIVHTWIGSGTNAATGDAISAKALFTVSTNGTLLVTVLNTTGNTLGRGDVLTGIFFDVSGSVTTPTDGASKVTTSYTSPVTSGQESATYQNSGTGGNLVKDATQASIDGSFVFKDVHAITGTSFKYGVNSSGFSNSGNNPNYSFSGFTTGGGGDDYAIVGLTTAKINGGAIELIRNEVNLSISGWGSNLTSASQISSMSFAFGSGAQTVGGTATYITVAGAQTPEPGSFALLGAAMGTGFCIYRKRKTKAVSPRK